jgi:hypothetical protein
MANPLPLILIGGGALLLLGGKKKKKRYAKAEPIPEKTPSKPLPGLEEEDLDKEDGEPTPSPSPTPTPSPTPGPTPLPEPSDPYGKPSMGPTGVGSCANSIYTRDPQYITPDILTANNALALFSEPGYFFYIRRDFQKQIYDYMLERFAAMKNGQERRTVASVVLREALKHFNSGCKWENPIDTLGEPEKLVWDGATRLAIIAQTTVGLRDPDASEMFRTGNRYTITRDSLGTPDPGFMGASQNKKAELPGTRVEIVASDKSQANAEHIIGEIVKLTGPNGEPNLFEIRIVGTFQGADVAPRLRTKHGFKVGSNAYFSQQGPTGIYRIFPKDMV